MAESRWKRREPGWYVHPEIGSISRDGYGWCVYPGYANKWDRRTWPKLGPFRTLEDARIAAEEWFVSENEG